MKFQQYGTSCAEECSEVTESTVPYLLKTTRTGIEFIHVCVHLADDAQIFCMTMYH